MLYNGMNRAQNPDSSELFQGYSYSDKGKDTEMYDWRSVHSSAFLKFTRKMITKYISYTKAKKKDRKFTKSMKQHDGKW